MFGFGWSEILLVMVIGFFILEPKDLKNLTQKLAKLLRYSRWTSGKVILEVDKWLEQAEQDEMQKLLREKYPNIFLHTLPRTEKQSQNPVAFRPDDVNLPEVELVGEVAELCKNFVRK